MNRVKYIKEFINSEIVDFDYHIIYALILSLTPKQTCELIDLNFKQNYKIRRLIAYKISNDIENKYHTYHKNMILNILEKINNKSFPKKEAAARFIDIIYHRLPQKEQCNILNKLLNSPYSKIRNMAYKRMKDYWEENYVEHIHRNWIKFKDNSCINIIINNFPSTYLLENYKELIKYVNPYQLSKLFLIICNLDYKKVKELKEIDQVSYVYVVTKFNKKITEKEAKEILINNYQNERVGLLIWCFGKMRLWDVIVYYKDKILPLVFRSKKTALLES
jgi:hypothetical protein